MIVYTYKKTTVDYLFILYEDFYSGLISSDLIDVNEIQRMVSCDARSTDNKSYMWRLVKWKSILSATGIHGERVHRIRVNAHSKYLLQSTFICNNSLTLYTVKKV